MNKKTEKLRLLWVVLIAIVVGLLSGYIWQFLLLMLFAYIIWLLSGLFELENWLYKGAITEQTPYTSGTIGGIIGNIVKLKNKQKKSKKSYQKLIIRFNEVLRSFPYPTVVINADSEIQWLSKDAGKILGLNRKKNVGIRISNIFRSSEFQTMLSKPDLSEFQMQSPTNENIILAIAISKLSKDTRILSIRDVSDKRRLEKLRTTFISNTSHELRTPLTIINGYLEMLNQNPNLSMDAKFMVDKAYQHSQRITTLVADLLMLSGLENSEVQVSKFEAINIGLLVDEVVGNIYNTSDFEHRVVYDIDEKLTIDGVHSQIYSMIFNLIENALKYSDDEVKVLWRVVDNRPTLKVIDQGRGFDEEDKSRLIEPFYRSKEAHTKQIQGTGLGLCIVNQAVLKNKGRLVIDSKQGQGSTFSVIFD